VPNEYSFDFVFKSCCIIICVLRRHYIYFLSILIQTLLFNLYAIFANVFGAYTICQMQFIHIHFCIKIDGGV